jgi:hypothetical protein
MAKGDQMNVIGFYNDDKMIFEDAFKSLMPGKYLKETIIDFTLTTMI